MSDNERITNGYLCTVVKSMPHERSWPSECVDIGIYLKGADNDYWNWIRNRMGLNRFVRRKSTVYQRKGQDILCYTNFKCLLTLQLLDSNRFIIVFGDGYQMEGRVAAEAVTRYQVGELSDLYDASEKKGLWDEKHYKVLFTNDWINGSNDIQYIVCPVARVVK